MVKENFNLINCSDLTSSQNINEQSADIAIYSLKNFEGRNSSLANHTIFIYIIDLTNIVVAKKLNKIIGIFESV